MGLPFLDAVNQPLKQMTRWEIAKIVYSTYGVMSLSHSL